MEEECLEVQGIEDEVQIGVEDSEVIYPTACVEG
jgi:hypothetical protein